MTAGFAAPRVPLLSQPPADGRWRSGIEPDAELQGRRTQFFLTRWAQLIQRRRFRGLPGAAFRDELFQQAKVMVVAELFAEQFQFVPQDARRRRPVRAEQPEMIA